MAVQPSPFLDPLWRRIVLVAFCFAWAGWEFYNGAALWAVMAAGMGVYGGWMYLYDYGRTPPAAPPQRNDEESP
jgi:hypothetical protein